MLSVRALLLIAFISLVSSFFTGGMRAGAGMRLTMAEKTYIMVKPDGVQVRVNLRHNFALLAPSIAPSLFCLHIHA